MKKDPDIRAKALADQLREIDLRVDAAEEWRSSWRQRGAQLVSSGALLYSVSQMGLDLTWSFLAVVVFNLSVEPLIRLLMIRKARRERSRVVRLFEEIDRRAALVVEGTRGEDPQL